MSGSRRTCPAKPLPSLDTKDGFEAHRAWEHELHAGGWAVVSWPEEYGGKSASLVEWLVFEEEYYRVGAPRRVGQNGIFLLAPTIFEFGSEEQQKRLLPRMANGDDIWSQAWSEPGAGSDLAAIRSTATKVDGGWVLNGQKTWSTRAVFADWAFGLFRSDPEAPRHAGLTYYLFPLVGQGRHGAPDPPARRRGRASRRSSATTSSSPTRTCSACPARAGRSRCRPPAPSAG